MKQKLKENKCDYCGEYGLCTPETYDAYYCEKCDIWLNRDSLYRCAKCEEYFKVLAKNEEEAKEKKRLSFIKERDKLLELNIIIRRSYT